MTRGNEATGVNGEVGLVHSGRANDMQAQRLKWPETASLAWRAIF